MSEVFQYGTSNTCGLHVVNFFEEINRAGILVILVCKNKLMIFAN